MLRGSPHAIKQRHEILQTLPSLGGNAALGKPA